MTLNPMKRWLIVLVGLTLATSSCTPRASRDAVDAIPTTVQTTGSPTPSGLPCNARVIRDSVNEFLHVWNRADPVALGRLFASDVRLDMSSKDQGNGPPKRGGYRRLSGARAIERFAVSQWGLGQRFSAARIRTFDHQGAYVQGLRARYADGTQQSFEEAKFVYSCPDRAFGHIVLVASKPAS